MRAECSPVRDKVTVLKDASWKNEEVMRFGRVIFLCLVGVYLTVFSNLLESIFLHNVLCRQFNLFITTKEVFGR